MFRHCENAILHREVASDRTRQSRCTARLCFVRRAFSYLRLNRDNLVPKQFLNNTFNSRKSDTTRIRQIRYRPRPVDQIQNAKQNAIAFRILIIIDMYTETRAEQFTLEQVHRDDVILDGVHHVQNQGFRVLHMA
jgi:hypothetical protein